MDPGIWRAPPVRSWLAHAVKTKPLHVLLVAVAAIGLPAASAYLWIAHAPSPDAVATADPVLRRPERRLPDFPSINAAQASSFLTQATFGPTLEEIDRVRTLGYKRWIDEQFAHPVSSQLQFLEAARAAAGLPATQREHRLDAWLTHALGGTDPFDPSLVHRDQLRQRIAFALSEIMVVSDATSDNLGGAREGMTHYYDTLARGASGNFRDLIEDVTLHPVMGIYLSMLGNEKPDPARNIRPDENYAREVLQLFSVGTVLLHIDGTPVLDESGNPIPTYAQDAVRGFAHVFTGWSFSFCEWGFRGCYNYDHTHPSWVQPMHSYPAFHASAQSKQLLVYPGVALPGGILPAGGTPESDLAAALDNIFRHPNVGPFIGKQLIQRLVTSNPSPAYVRRVARAFNDNGYGVRGDMKAVAAAVLLDAEARDNMRRPRSFGKAREPLLRVMHLLRAMDASSGTGHSGEFWNMSSQLGQMPMSAPSVFNFFSPTYKPPGLLTELGLVAPELQLATDYMLPSQEAYFYRKIIEWAVDGPVGTGTYAVNLRRDIPLAADANALLDRYDVLFLSGRMSPRMRSVLVQHLERFPGNDHAGRRRRVQEALYLILNSAEYVAQK